MTSTLKSPIQQRHPSRPDSASSSSAATVHRASSLSSRSGLRPKNRSPVDVPLMPAGLSNPRLSPEARRISPEKKRRSSALYAGPDSRYGLHDGASNLNRWSQSTASSNNSNHKKRSSFSRLSGSFGSFGAFGASQSPTLKSQYNPTSPSKQYLAMALSPPPANAPILPPIEALSSLSQAVDSAESPAIPATATPKTADMLSAVSNGPDYFGEQWNPQPKSGPPARAHRTSTAPRNLPPPLALDQPVRSSITKPPESVYSPRVASRLKRERRQSQNHRRRADSNKSNPTNSGDSSASDHREHSGRQHRRRAPSQKALLSKALAKANHAVVLDGQQNIEGAILAYGDACNLLRQVMVRSSGDEDRRKLETVRNTYKNRIVELRNLDVDYQSSENKVLPERPERDSAQTELTLVTDEERDQDIISPGRFYSSEELSSQTQRAEPPMIPPRRQSLQPRLDGDPNQPFGLFGQAYGGTFVPSQSLQQPLYEEDMPPPLSPRRRSPEPNQEANEDQSDGGRKNEAEHTSWLNTIAESSGSEASSVHSRRSLAGLRRRHIKVQRESGQTEAEFNAALDAAVEAAYDEGFEPDDEEDDDEHLINDPEYQFEETEPLSLSLRNVELAKENVREAEREAAIHQAKEREKQRLHGVAIGRDSIDIEYGDNETDEDERMLDEMTKDYILDVMEDDGQSKSALPPPRQSGSSGFSRRTWASSNGSNPTTAGTSLTTVAEALPSLATQLEENPMPLHPPPSSALPQPPVPEQPEKPASFAIRNSSPGVRDRRLSGKAAQLKIDIGPRSSTHEAPKTQQPPAPPPLIPPQAVPDPPRSAFIPEENDRPAVPISNTVPAIPLPRKDSSPHPGFDAEPISSAASTLTKVNSGESDTSVPSVPGSPARFTKAATGLRKNFSSSSLRNKALNAADGPDASPNTSISSASSMPKQRGEPSPAVPVPPTPLETSFLPKGQPSGGIYLFDCDIHSPTTPGSPNPASVNAPLQLEPCPESTLLRPFWLLRSVYQTIAHPRGGYLTTRLFVPRDIWRVKNIKLKHVEEKVSSCDLLTAALLKLGKVDTYNADAVLEEMQFLESVMDQVQMNLSKKLGNDVGVQGAGSLFKGASNPVDDSASNSEAFSSKSINGSGKSYLSSWRKLRSKNSLGPSLGSTNQNVSKDGQKEPPTMKSLPMTAIPDPRFPRRDVSQVQCMGPNPSYMGALARLCDAAQTLDQIARQVEDPGLKHSSPTHVGLELSTRHAAEFFAFYICRFVFADVGLMLDKFIKRGSEWVLD